MISNAWKYLRCKLGGDCSHLEQPSLVARLMGYLNPTNTTPGTILLAIAMVAMSAILVHFKPDPRQMFQTVKSALRLGPETSEAIVESSSQTVNSGGNPIPRGPPLGVAVYPAEVYPDRGVSVQR